MTRKRLLALALGGLLAGASVACPSSPTDPPSEAPPASSLDAPTLRVPRAPGKQAPAMSEFVGSGAVDGNTLESDASSCVPCHADVVRMWRSSAHSASSFSNPIYRASVRGFREAQGGATSRFCAGCHDVALLLDGAMDGVVRADDVRAHAGVTCLTCHSIRAATRDGNGSYTLRTDPVVMPREGDAASLRAHRQRLAPDTLRTVELCTSCHRAFLGPATGHGHYIAGADDYGAWLSSAYAGNRLDRVDEEVAPAGCRDCHMPPAAAPEGDVAARGGKVRSHGFVGGHTWLAAMRSDAKQLASAQAMLRGAASVDVVAVRAEDGALYWPASTPVTPAMQLDLEVVVTNERVGHRFPGGTLDMHDVWIEVVVEDASGRALAEHGVGHTADATVADAHVLHASLVDDRGRAVLARRVEAFRAVAFDTTILPRDSVVVPYRLAVPNPLEPAQLPLRATVRLLHRSREAELARVACGDPERPAYERITALDPCVPQPITVVASTTITLGDGSPPPPMSEILAARLLRHGSAWQHALVEEIDKARPSLLRVVTELSASSPRAQALLAGAAHQLAWVAARQGRIVEMDSWLEQAETLLPGQPAFAFVRGRGLASVWRHQEAQVWFRVAASGAPTDPRGWSGLAVALGSVGRDREALAAAQNGLRFASRSEDLLRVQSLALLTEDPRLHRAAQEAFLAHRVRDDAPELRMRCADMDAECAQERTLGHRHFLMPVPP